jgi:succinate dehydrogenase / fumarate reductase, membrane anchor subunit
VASTAEETRPGAAPTATGTHTPRRRPKQNFETWSWFFMRVTGLVLLFMALLHFAITHIINDVVETDAEFVANRWENPLWRTFDWMLLALALTHGLNGMRWIIDDYVRSRRGRATVKAVLYTVTGVLFAYGTFTIVTFGAL